MADGIWLPKGTRHGYRNEPCGRTLKNVLSKKETGRMHASASIDAGRKLVIVSVLLLVICVTNLPGIIAARLGGNVSISWLIGLRGAGAMLMLMVPIAVAWWKPSVAQFDMRWLPRRWVDGCWAFAMVVVTLAWAAIGGYVLSRVGIDRGRGYVNVETVSPALVLVRAGIGIVLGPVAEEVLWRGYVLAQLKRIMPPTWAVLIQGAGFSLFHFGPLELSIIVCGYGVIFGYWRHRMGSFLPIMVSHIALNAMVMGPLWYAVYDCAMTQSS